ncbi:hypothetical protein EVAR_7217_1 [Eumeta japonica]|uniref:Uncharacterized protein n=1 Tax=Eumeta variegata TaxID=151549 RepID=A0A4C1T329_EUMVA|nr:hypothetical protein EVAR_7217_1 [Eumeta japonica]
MDGLIMEIDAIFGNVKKIDAGLEVLRPQAYSGDVGRSNRLDREDPVCNLRCLATRQPAVFFAPCDLAAVPDHRDIGREDLAQFLKIPNIFNGRGCVGGGAPPGGEGPLRRRANANDLLATVLN